MAKRYWLMKTEPDAYSIDDLERDGVTPWEGVRSYQARNLLRDEIHVGDSVLFYHSSTEPPGVVGLAEVVHESHPDRSAFDPASPYYDPKSTPDAPRWFAVDVRFVERFPGVVPLAVLHTTPGLERMLVIKRGMRLSVQPVTPEEWDIVVALGRAARPEAVPVPAPDAGGTDTKRKATDAKRKTAPAKHKAAPAKREAAPAKRKATDAKRKATDAKRKTAPAKHEATATKRKAAGTKVARRDSAPGGRRTPARQR